MSQQSTRQCADSKCQKIVFEITLNLPPCLLLSDSVKGVEADGSHDQIGSCGNGFINPDVENLNGGLYEFQKHIQR